MTELSGQNANILIVANKTDLNQQLHEQFPYGIFISARKGIGIEVLKDKLFTMAGGGQINNENIVVTNARHYAAIRGVKKLKDIKEALITKFREIYFPLDINRCLHYLGEITGEITNEDRLDYIFSKFCIGK